MKRKVLLFILMLFFSNFIMFAQDTTEVEKNWKLTGFFQQSLNQVSFTNWAAGGENSFASTTQARFDANYNKDRYSWENYIDLNYGIIKLADNPLRKNIDKIDVFSKLGRSINEQVSYTAILNFLSQFDEGFKY